MTNQQLAAIQNPCRFAFETVHPRFPRRETDLPRRQDDGGGRVFFRGEAAR